MVVLAVAVADSLRGDGRADEVGSTEPATSPADPLLAGRDAIAERLRHEGIGGRLLYTDRRCVIRALTLPDLTPAPPPRSRSAGCGFAASPDGRRVATRGADWSPDSRRVAVCRGRSVAVSVGSEHARPTHVVPGCTPAWRPGGGLTIVRDGAVVTAAGVPVVRAGALEALGRGQPVGGDRVVVDVLDVDWLTRDRVAVLMRSAADGVGPSRRHVAVFERGRMVAVEAAVSQAWARVEAQGGLVAVEPGWLVDADARALYPPPGTRLGRADAVAVSPDGRWVALGLTGRVTLLSVSALREGRFRSVSLPLATRDLAWR